MCKYQYCVLESLLIKVLLVKRNYDVFFYLKRLAIREDTQKKSSFFSVRTTKGVGRGNPPPTTKQKHHFFL